MLDVLDRCWRRCDRSVQKRKKPAVGRAIGDHADLEDLYNTERHLLYVACTRARDHLLITGVDPVSEFLEDLRR